MGTAEEHLTKIIKAFGEGVLAELARTAEKEKKGVEEFITKYLEGYRVDLPLSIKPILDKGGQIRQLMLDGQTGQRYDQNGRPLPEGYTQVVFSAGYSHSVPTVYETATVLAAKNIRITIIVEPSEE